MKKGIESIPDLSIYNGIENGFEESQVLGFEEAATLYNESERDEPFRYEANLPYSLQFYEVADVFSKYLLCLDDHKVKEILNAYFTFPNIDDFIEFLEEEDGFNLEIIEDIHERLTRLDNSDISKIDLTRKIYKFGKDIASTLEEYGYNLSWEESTKAGFAIIKIFERSIFDSDFDFIDKINSYFTNNLPKIGPIYELDQCLKQRLMKIIIGESEAPISGMIKKYRHYDIMDTESIFGELNEFDWRSLSEGIYELLKTTFSYKRNGMRFNEDQVKEILDELFVGCDSLLPKSVPRMTDSFRRQNQNFLSFENFARNVKNLMLENSNIRNREEWNRFTLARFVLEGLLKLYSIETTYNRRNLEIANEELVSRLCRYKGGRQQFIRYESNDPSIYCIVLTKIMVRGEPRNILIKIAKPKSEEAMLRKLMARSNAALHGIGDKMRIQILVDDESLFLGDEDVREETIRAIIVALMSKFGNGYKPGSVKNTFNTGKSNPLSNGLRCFKYVMKFLCTTRIDNLYPIGMQYVEVMITYKGGYPDDHHQYEERNYRLIREKYALCSYEQAMSQLSEELKAKVLIGLENSDYQLLDPLFYYVLNEIEDGNINNIDLNFAQNILFIFYRLKSDDTKWGENISDINRLIFLTKLDSLKSLVRSSSRDAVEVEDMGNLSQ